MEKESYHHGSLKEEMIEKGLLLINNEGTKGFSLRKVAAMCHVSHTAPYKHFKNKEELMQAISDRVLRSFSQCLREAMEKESGKDKTLSRVGKAYVKYMVENKEYFRFIFFSECGVSVKLIGDKFVYDKGNPFEVFYMGATSILKKDIKDQSVINSIILNMWGIVHGISTLIINGNFQYEGTYEELIEQMLNIDITCLQ